MSNYKHLPEHVRETRAKKLVEIFLERGKVNFVTGVPCAVQKFVIKEFLSKDVTHIIANTEGEAIGIGAGASFGGKTPLVYMQNSGLMNNLHNISSLLVTYNIPLLLLISWRGLPGEKAVHHSLDGKNTELFLSRTNIPYLILEPKTMFSELKTFLEKSSHIGGPSAILLKRGVV